MEKKLCHLTQCSVALFQNFRRGSCSQDSGAQLEQMAAAGWPTCNQQAQEKMSDSRAEEVSDINVCCGLLNLMMILSSVSLKKSGQNSCHPKHHRPTMMDRLEEQSGCCCANMRKKTSLSARSFTNSHCQCGVSACCGLSKIHLMWPTVNAAALLTEAKMGLMLVVFRKQ